jgi:hypothetical protein
VVGGKQPAERLVAREERALRGEPRSVARIRGCRSRYSVPERHHTFHVTARTAAMLPPCGP